MLRCNCKRLVLSKLSCLAGGLDLEMAVNAVADANISMAEATACIAKLVSKSPMERHEMSDANVRILNCIRFYARRR